MLFNTAYATSSNLTAVIYPETPVPYSNLFDSIIKGIETEKPTVISYSINNKTHVADLNQWIENTKPENIITLGQQAYQLYQATGKTLAPIVGAMDATPDTHPQLKGISLTVDPAILFRLLKQLKPATQRVLVVYQPDKDRWLIQQAKQAAKLFGLTLVAYTAEDLKQSTQHFWNIFKYSNPNTDALWLTSDLRLINDNNLPSIIEQSWYAKLTVFSSSLNHANQGVLFSVYPDLELLGKRLAELATTSTANKARTIELLRSTKAALNLKISKHLDIHIDNTLRSQFDLTLGVQ